MMEEVRHYPEADYAKLDGASKLYFDIRLIPNMQLRAELWIYANAFEVGLAQNKRNITKVQRAVDTVR